MRKRRPSDEHRITQPTLQLRALAKGGASVAGMAQATRLTEAQVLSRLNPPERQGVRLYTHKVNTMFASDIYDQLVAYAAARGVNVPEAIRTFVEWGLDVEGDLA